MKRIVISILIGGLCCLFYLAISGLSSKKSKGSLLGVLENRNPSKQVDETFYKGAIKLDLGRAGDSAQKLRKVISQIEMRMGESFAGMTLDSGLHILNVKSVSDTNYIKKMLTESVKIEFKEVFSFGEISEQIIKANEEITKNDKKAFEKETEYHKILKADTAKEKLSTILAEKEITDVRTNSGLVSFIRFSQPYSMPSGETKYPAELGYVRSKDTAALNQILNKPEIGSHFPETMSFAYGSDNYYLPEDSLLKIFALKQIDQRYTPYPTNDQITNAEMIFEPTINSPVINMAFNDAGSHAWYEMTKRNVHKPIAMLANNFVLSAPFVESAIEGGESRITGAFSVAECVYLAKIMLSEELAQPVKIVETRFTIESSNKTKQLKILGIIFLITAVLGYGISLVIKPNSKP